jgi:mRNA-degrading endonuclease RelE of RelBE toxin-antitoxin system
MAKRIVWTTQARSDIRGIDKPAALQIFETLSRYASRGSGDAKQLKGRNPPLSRLRSQNYRILFRDQGAHLEIVRVRDRKDAYR